jgi:carboxylate-amine ligase
MASSLARPFDEAWAGPGSPRPEYAGFLGALEGIDLSELSASVAEQLARDGVRFGGSPFVVDPIPRILSAPEWAHLEAGLEQRARALNRFLHDAYGTRKIVDAGIVDARTIEEAEGFEPDLSGRLPSHPWPAAIIGFDLVRDPDGEFLVLEDNLRTPSGFAYATGARAALLSALPSGTPVPRAIEPVTWALLHEVMLSACPRRTPDPVIVVLTDGPDNVAFHEHARAARALDAILATPEQLIRDGPRLSISPPGTDGLLSVDVVYRRTNEDRVRDEDGSLTPVAEKLLEPWTSGTLGLVNAFGNGIADDKLLHGHVEDFIRFYLQEEPVVRSVPTTHVESDVVGTIERLAELVIKPRHSHGGIGVVVGPHADRPDLEKLADELRRNPHEYIAQPTVSLSTHPTVIDGRLEPRHVDLRPFSFAATGVKLMPGGLSRVAFDAGALVVNSSQNGGGKDTWVLDA